jgi:hypothetical protein
MQIPMFTLLTSSAGPLCAPIMQVKPVAGYIVRTADWLWMSRDRMFEIRIVSKLILLLICYQEKIIEGKHDGVVILSS